MSMMQAVVVDLSNRLVLREVEEPSPTPSESLIRVAAVSLSRGEVHGRQPPLRKVSGRVGTWPGQSSEPQRTSGPSEGTRIVGLLQKPARGRSWRPCRRGPSRRCRRECRLLRRRRFPSQALQPSTPWRKAEGCLERTS